MTSSASTPRLRLTVALYVLLLAATAVNAPRAPAEPAVAVALALLAFVLVSIAVLGRIWCSVFIAGRKDSELVTGGPYAFCRHPLYALSVVGALGLGLATGSLVLAVLTPLVIAVVVSRAAAREERALAERYGERFTDYAALVPRWWPKLQEWQSPPEVRVPPEILWKAFVDGGAFLALYGLIVAARWLAASGALPALIALP